MMNLETQNDNNIEKSPNPKQKPSTAFLIILNALIIFALCTATQSPAAILFGIIAFVAFIVPSSLAHLVLYLITRKKNLNPLIKTALYLSPAIFIAALTIMASQMPDLPNQQQNLTSPNGKYILNVPTSSGAWTVTISDPDGNILYKDVSNFLANFNAYWCWDKENRVWLYNSDDGKIYFWENTNNHWQRTHWGRKYKNETQRNISPPKKLYPGKI